MTVLIVIAVVLVMLVVLLAMINSTTTYTTNNTAKDSIRIEQLQYGRLRQHHHQHLALI